MNVSISIENFYERREYVLGLLFWGIIISVIGAMYITISSPWIESTYYTHLKVKTYINMVFGFFYPAITLSFLLSHIKIVRQEEREGE